MRTRNVVVVTVGLLVALVLTVTGAVYAIDQWVATPRDRALCSIVSSQSAVVNALADDLTDQGRPVSPELSAALEDLRGVREPCR